MSNGIIFNVPEVIRTYNVSRSTGITTTYYTTSIITETISSIPVNSHISPIECLGFVVLILTTVIGNTLVLAALFLDKRLHTPSFFLIANMAIADLLLGLSVLPFSSVLELLNDRWIFGQSFCTAWLALDVLCCTASIIGLMAVSIDRYIGVTRPLTYSTIMTTHRTIYLIIIVWTVSILTSVVPLFGLTDRKNFTGIKTSRERLETCRVNKNTFYTIFSSSISFYIPVIILLILYSRVYQEAKKQGKKLEQEKRRIYEFDYQIAAEHARQRQNHTNGHTTLKTRTPSNQSTENKYSVSKKLLNHETTQNKNGISDHTLQTVDDSELKDNSTKLKSEKGFDDDDASNSACSFTANKKSKHRFVGKRLFSALKRNSLLHTPQAPEYNREMPPNNELLLIKRKIHNLKREQKAFRTVGLILGALLICWLPFFVMLPVMSIQEQHNATKISRAENTWFKIAFWLGYCNSALNPFVYAFSNRAIRRAFRQMICRRCCCCFPFCRQSSDKSDEGYTRGRKRAQSGSLTTDISQSFSRGLQSTSIDIGQRTSKSDKDVVVAVAEVPAISFADFLAEKSDDDEDDKPLNEEPKTTLLKESQMSPAIS